MPRGQEGKRKEFLGGFLEEVVFQQGFQRKQVFPREEARRRKEAGWWNSRGSRGLAAGSQSFWVTIHEGGKTQLK